MSLHHVENYKGFEIEINYDSDAINPEEEIDNLIFCLNSRYFKTDNQDKSKFKVSNIEEYIDLKSKISQQEKLKSLKDLTFNEKYLQELNDELKGYFDYSSEYYIHPVYLKSYSTSNYKLCFDFDREYNEGFILIKKVKDDVEIVKNYVKLWNTYLSNEVYCSKIYLLKEYTKVYDNGDKSERGVDKEYITSISNFYNRITELIKETKILIDEEYGDTN